MVMRRAGLLIALAVTLALFPARADAADIAVNAQVLAGTRTITTATLTPLADVLRAVSVDATLAVTVTEASVNGVTPWSVTVDLCGTDGSGAINCAAGNVLVLDGDVGTTIAGSNLTIGNRAVTPVVTLPVVNDGTTTATSGTQDLSATRTIFETTDQDPTKLYTGTYASTSTISLTPPADAAAGAYEGFLVVTLVN